MKFKNTLIICAIMLTAAIFLKYLNHAEDIHPNKPLSTFPLEIGEWSGKINYFNDEVYTILGVDDSVLANYRNPAGRDIQLYVGFYQSQREGEIIHSPKNCMPGGGWKITQAAMHELTVPEMGNKNIELIKMDLQNGSSKLLVLYWYQSRGRIINSEYLQKVYLVFDSITRKRTDGSFVRLLTPVVNNNEKATLNDLSNFAKDILPILGDYLPS